MKSTVVPNWLLSSLGSFQRALLAMARLGRSLGLRVTVPELVQRPAGDHLHGAGLIPHHQLVIIVWLCRTIDAAGVCRRSARVIELMSEGLEGVIAARTVLSHADGENGTVWVRGHNIGDLVACHGYEGTIALLWDGFAGAGLTRQRLLDQLGEARALAFSRLPDWLPLAAKRPLIEGVRIALAALPEESIAATIAGALPVAVAALVRTQQGRSPVPPDAALATAADFLRMVADGPVEQKFATALDAYLTAVIDNGLGTSTFAARVIISTRASLVSAVLGAYGAFTGSLHGGAPSLALDMLDAIAASGDIDAWLDRTLANGGRLMGFGHRVFRVRDPRADILRAALEQLDPGSQRLAMAQEVERRAVATLARHKPGRRLEANIEMDAALLLDAIGLPRAAFTPVFAIARAPAWIAHALEQQKTGRMIRPQSVYVGKLSGG
jgi:citrate synthase